LISAIGASFTISYLFNLMDGHHYLLFWRLPALLGPSPQAIPDFLEPKEVFSLFGTPFNNTHIIVIVVAVVMMVVLDTFVRRSRLGRGIRAVAQDAETASLMGVNIDRIIVATFFIGGLMAGAAGFLFSGIHPGAPAFWFIGFYPGIKAFTAAVLGGIGNIRGAMAGGLLLGMVEAYSGPCFGFQWVNVVAFVVLVLVLLFRPTGIFGEQVGA
jgi:branched-chain amino acid transport system permease protein